MEGVRGSSGRKDLDDSASSGLSTVEHYIEYEGGNSILGSGEGCLSPLGEFPGNPEM